VGLGQKMVFFSTIIPVFNRADLIERTLESVFNQGFSDQEIIVIDDGSTDETLDVLTKYGDRIKVFHQENKGPGAARNLGINFAQGQYIVFLDSDDLWFPWTLSTFAQVAKNYNFPSLIAGSAFYFKDDLELSSIQAQSLRSQYFADYYTAASHDLPFLTSAVAIKRTVLQEIGGFTTRRINAEDNDLWLKLGIAKKFVYIHGPVLLGYRQHQDSAVADLAKTYQGTLHIIQQEHEGKYPGTQEKLIHRIEILTRHIRPVSLTCLQKGKRAEAWLLYWKTFMWNLKLGRIRYLLGFLVLAGMASLKNNRKFID
jgi:glycosyltransferase involved in cell wall biosynthesis